MFIFDPEKVSEFLDRIARGFQHRPFEIILFFVLILLFIAFLITFSLIQRRRARQERLRRAQERYERIAAKLGLSPEERALVERLAAMLRSPERLTQVLESSAAFHYAAERMGNGADPAALAELRLRLGFRAQNPESIPSASSELPEGIPVLLVCQRPEGARRYGAVVHAQQPDALVLELAGPPPSLIRGQSVTVILQNRSGLFSFTTGVRSLHGSLLYLDHSEQLHRTQRRRYYRRRLSLPVEVRRVVPGSSPQPVLASHLLDLGGQGASLRNPGGSFAPGDELQLRFRLGGEPFELEVEVLRLSKGGQVLHVRFLALREAARDRILHALFRNLGEASR